MRDLFSDDPPLTKRTSWNFPYSSVLSRMRVDIYHLADESTAANWHRLFQQLNRIERKIDMADMTLDDILATSEAEESEVASLIALTTGLKTQLDQALVGEPISPAGKAKMNKIFANLQAQKDEIAAAILANTPSAATVTPTPAPAPADSPAPSTVPDTPAAGASTQTVA